MNSGNAFASKAVVLIMNDGIWILHFIIHNSDLFLHQGLLALPYGEETNR